MNRPDDDIDNLLRNHFASELDSRRGESARAFEREVTRPMNRRLRHNAFTAIGQRVVGRARQTGPMLAAMAACAALGFYVPRWVETTPAGPAFAETPATPNALVDYEQAGPAAGQIDTANFIDPATNTRTEYYLFPAGREMPVPTGRQ